MFTHLFVGRRVVQSGRLVGQSGRSVGKVGREGPSGRSIGKVGWEDRSGRSVGKVCVALKGSGSRPRVMQSRGGFSFFQGINKRSRNLFSFGSTQMA